ncbi:ATP-binding protein [Dinoroseobacter sp. S76]|uniref:ATP-binding protein n=1 Tax=Dinoroseobacter sp. S76 TaxID=3415124 RepID=UPI003C7E6328
MDPTLSNAALTEVLETCSDGMAIFDGAQCLARWNARFEADLPETELVLRTGLSWADLCGSTKGTPLSEGFASLDTHVRAGLDAPQTQTVRTAGGDSLSLTLRPLAGAGFLLAIANAPARPEAAGGTEPLSALSRLIEASPINLVIYDLGRERFVQWTPAWADLYGDPEDIQQIWVDPSDRDAYVAELRSAGRIDNFEAQFRGRGGRIFPGRVSARLVAHEGTTLSLASTTDMTTYYAQRDELARQREAAFQTEKLTALGELLAGVAHELNNPLSVVAGQALMLQDDTQDPEALRRIDKIRSSADRCSKIVTTFLAMARQKPSRLVPIDLNETIELALDVGTYGLRRAGIPVERSLAPDLPRIPADEDQIAQVVMNLLVNAEQAMAGSASPARVRIETWHDPARGMVCASIADTGPGVPDALQARIFEPFFTTKGVGQGTGIGLALCHRVAHSHNGRLDYAPAEGGGACFILSLPAAQDRIETPRPAAPG